MKIRVALFGLVFALGVLSQCFANGTSTCDELRLIRDMPFKDEKVDDDSYNRLRDLGMRVVPCLIENLSDGTKMDDPRRVPPNPNVTVGDVAFFMLLRITNVNITDILPSAVADEYRSRGMEAYFVFVDRSENRQVLKSRWQEWWASNAP